MIGRMTTMDGQEQSAEHARPNRAARSLAFNCGFLSIFPLYFLFFFFNLFFPLIKIQVWPDLIKFAPSADLFVCA